ncbi:hypothetical protein M271_08420 [Streptomyces rapamycinicus NRRL 5491]|nr:hypothetical protein M271_08420 [Streptomyces rapamycinicus NRRL 5491]
MVEAYAAVRSSGANHRGQCRGPLLGVADVEVTIAGKPERRADDPRKTRSV